MAGLPSSWHPLHCSLRIPDLRTGDNSPLRTSFRREPQKAPFPMVIDHAAPPIRPQHHISQLDRDAASTLDRGNHKGASKMSMLCTPNSKRACVMFSDAVQLEKLDAAFSELSVKIRPTDVFVLYLAGHGKTVDGRYYFVPQNFKMDGVLSDPVINAAITAQGIAQEQWQRWFALVSARKSLILFDTCESGTLTADDSETKAIERGGASGDLSHRRCAAARTRG